MRIMVLLLFLAALPAAATQVYRWVDADGQVHYSDQWKPGAEKIQIAESVVFNTPKAASGDSQSGGPASAQDPGQQGKPEQTGPRYESLEIASPAQEEVLWNIEGQLRVSVRVNPSLQPGHGLRLYLDGEAQDLPAGSTQAQLKDVYRGAHTLKAAVVNSAGTVLLESQPRTFMVRQTSLANPSRPALP